MSEVPAWKKAAKEALEGKHRGDANEIAIKAILDSLSDDQVSEFLSNDEVSAYFDDNGIGKPEDKQDIDTAMAEWDDDFKTGFVELFTK